MMELWAHQASLGLLVNLAVRVPQGLLVLRPQVRATLFHLTYSVALLASLLERAQEDASRGLLGVLS